MDTPRGGSRRRREIARIIDDMEGQLFACAESHFLVATQKRGMRTLKYVTIERKRLIALARKGAGALVHRNLRKGLNGWIDLMVRIAAALAQLRAAAMTFRNRASRAALNTWIAKVAEKAAKLAAMRNAMLSFIHAALAKAWRKMLAIYVNFRRVKRATASFVNRALRKGHNSWTHMVREKARKLAAMHRALGSFKNKNLRKGFNTLVAARAERLRKLALLREAGRSFVQRAIRKGWRQWLPLLRLRQAYRLAANSFRFRNRRKGFNGWVALMKRRADALLKMQGAASSLVSRASRAALNTWKGKQEERRRMLARMASAVATMQGGRVRAAFNSIVGRNAIAASEFAKFTRAGQLWAGGARRDFFRRWLVYIEAQKQPQPPRPVSPGARKRVLWARSRAPHAPVRELAADDKYQCQRALMSPHAALALRRDGAVLRVVAVHRPGSEALCVVDLVRGYDELMLVDQPADHRADPSMASRCAAQAGGIVRVSAGSLSSPASGGDHLLIVPDFFGGTLRLSNTLDVRVIDARFGPSQAPLTGDEPEGHAPDAVLREVLLTLVDQYGESVGRPAWCPLLHLLELLPPESVVVAEAAEEDELRRRRRLALHRDEQRRLALHHLRLSSRRAVEAWGEGPSQNPAEQTISDGVEGLLRQLHSAAPSKLLDPLMAGDPRALAVEPASRVNAARPASAKLHASSSAKAFTPGYNDERRSSPPRGGSPKGVAVGAVPAGNARPRALYR